MIDTAIPVVENRAKLYRDTIRLAQFSGEYRNPLWPKEANIEMNTRILVRRDFPDLLNNSLSTSDLDALEWVLFGIAYPCIGYDFDVKRMTGYAVVGAR